MDHPFAGARADDVPLPTPLHDGCRSCDRVARGSRSSSVRAQRPQLARTSTVSAVSDPPASIVVGTPFTITATTTNAARHPARDSLTRFYLSTDAALGPTDVALSGAIAVKPREHHPSGTSLGCAHARCRASGRRTCSPAPTTRSASTNPTRRTTAALDRHVSFNPQARADPEPTPEFDRSQTQARRLAGRRVLPGADPSRARRGSDRLRHLTHLQSVVAVLGREAPARYDGAGSTGEDLSLFPRSGLHCRASRPISRPSRGVIARPTDPLSPFGPAAAGTRTGRPGGGPVHQVRGNLLVVAPGLSGRQLQLGFQGLDLRADAGRRRYRVDPVLTDFAGIEQLFTEPEPAGMGRPVPDTLAKPDNGGNGKIDVYLVGTNQCRDRNGDCAKIQGTEVGLAVPDGPTGEVPGFPERSSSGYIVVGLANAFDTTTLAHELFHILQFAHTVGAATPSWYTEASATWAEWLPSLRHLSKKELYDLFSDFQGSNLSLLDTHLSITSTSRGSGRSSRSCRSVERPRSTRPGRAPSRRVTPRASTASSTPDCRSRSTSGTSRSGISSQGSTSSMAAVQASRAIPGSPGSPIFRDSRTSGPMPIRSAWAPFHSRHGQRPRGSGRQVPHHGCPRA